MSSPGPTKICEKKGEELVRLDQPKAEKGTLLGRSFSLLKAGASLIGALATGLLAVAGLTVYVALRIITAVAFVTLIGIPVGLLTWAIYELEGWGTSAIVKLSYRLIKNTGQNLYEAFATTA